MDDFEGVGFECFGYEWVVSELDFGCGFVFDLFEEFVVIELVWSFGGLCWGDGEVGYVGRGCYVRVFGCEC